MNNEIDKIYHGFSENILPKLESNLIACSIWSPPYHIGKEYEKGQSFEEWKAMLKNIITLHMNILKPGGFMVVNISDILCFPDESMPKIQLSNPRKHKVKLTKEEILVVKEKNPHFNRNQLADYFGCSEQTIDRRLNGNNIRGGKYVTQTRVELVGGYLQKFGRDAGLFLYDRKIWKKDPSWQNSKWTSNTYKGVDEFEYLYIFWKPGEATINKAKLNKKEWVQWGSRSIWEFPSVRANKEHEAMFPIELPKRCIKLYTEENDVVLDPFIGSGTTAVAAIELGRAYIGIEKEEMYYKLALKNIQQKKEAMKQLKLTY